MKKTRQQEKTQDRGVASFPVQKTAAKQPGNISALCAFLENEIQAADEETIAYTQQVADRFFGVKVARGSIGFSLVSGYLWGLEAAAKMLALNYFDADGFDSQGGV